MSEKQASSFTMNNPAMVAAFTPFIAITPAIFITVFREASESWKIVFIIGYLLFIMLMVILAVILANQAGSLVFEPNKIRINKREYLANNLDQVSYSKKTKYVKLVLKKGMPPNMHLKDRMEEERFITELQRWTQENGIKLTIQEK